MWKAGAGTDPGLVRSDNQDYHLVETIPWGSEVLHLIAVADGVGGHQAGNVASKLAVMSLLDAMLDDSRHTDRLPDLRRAFALANSVVYREAENTSLLSGMGTTLTAVLLRGLSAVLCHIGDSRAYILRSGELSRLTEDHSVVQELIKNGRITASDALRHPQRHVLTRALGVAPEVKYDYEVIELMDGDQLLICSDGLTRTLEDKEIGEVLGLESSRHDKVSALIQGALLRGGPDNVTVVLAEWEEGE